MAPWRNWQYASDLKSVVREDVWVRAPPELLKKEIKGDEKMRKNFVPKYRFYTNGKNLVVAVTSFQGQNVRGVAKCNEQDEFDLETGKKLAAARCAMKIAKKRVKYAKIQREHWLKMMSIQADILMKAEDKYTDALEIEKQAKHAYEELVKGL